MRSLWFRVYLWGHRFLKNPVMTQGNCATMNLESQELANVGSPNVRALIIRKRVLGPIKL